MDDQVAASTLIVSLHDYATRAAVMLPCDATLDDVKDALRDHFDSMTTLILA